MEEEAGLTGGDGGQGNCDRWRGEDGYGEGWGIKKAAREGRPFLFS